MRACPCARRAAREARGRAQVVPWIAASARAGARMERRALVRRLQGHQRGRDDRRAARTRAQDGAHPRWRWQGTGLLAAARAGCPVRRANAADRPRCAAHREGARRAAHAALRNARRGGANGGRNGALRRVRAAVAGLRELRHVPRLQAPGRRVRRGRAEAEMSQTFVFARNAPDAEYDRSLTWAVLLLAVGGLVMVYSAS